MDMNAIKSLVLVVAIFNQEAVNEEPELTVAGERDRLGVEQLVATMNGAETAVKVYLSPGR